ncbi:RTA1-like protein [Flagelloscypha sp. PMI_526]|nr:RTA1-like protein [Flagelloscypha sp. PMI_526]
MNYGLSLFLPKTRGLWSACIENTTLAIRANSEDRLLNTPYGYTPTAWVCCIFLALFGTSGAVHLIQALWFKTYWLIPTAVVCALGECLGWSARLWSHYNVKKDTPFLIQISSTIISPTFLLAINFIIFGRVVNIFGQQYCLLPSRWISILFISADIIALVVQGVGGGLASSTKPTVGGNTMLAGIAFQFGIMIIACFIAFHFAWSWKAQRPIRQSVDDLVRTPMSTSTEPSFREKRILPVARIPLEEPDAAVYRLIELSDGWTGDIITTQKWFNIFDGAMVVLAIWTVNIANPGWLLPKHYPHGATSA